MKIRRISQLQGRLSFPNFDNNYEKYLPSFKRTNLGKIYSSVPWLELTKQFELKEHKKGPSAYAQKCLPLNVG